MKVILTILGLSLLLAGCGKKAPADTAPAEDTKAKAMLAGVWVDSEEGSVVFKVKGDSIYYPDSASQPVRFAVYPDTLVMYGSSVSKYKIMRMAKHLLELRNNNGDVVKVVKSSDPYDAAQFAAHPKMTLNQGTLIKRDTVVSHSDLKYHCYVQVNPTTYKVLRPSLNDEGIAVDRVYYDNIIHVSIYQGAGKVFSKDFHKKDFASNVPTNMLSQCVLSDMLLSDIDASGIHYTTQLAIPESPISYMVNVTVSYSGKVSMRVE